MYGTVAIMQAKPGKAIAFLDHMKRYEAAKVPGAVATYIFRMDSDPNKYFVTVLFESKVSYVANADSPEQDARYRDLLDLLVSEPEWHDGEIVHSGVYSKLAAG